MPQTLAAASAILKEIYEPDLRFQLEDRKILWKRLQSSSKGIESNVGGKYVVFPIHIGRNSGIGARLEMEDLPLAGQQKTAAGRVGLKYLYGSIQLTGQALALIESNYQAFISALELEQKGINRDLSKDMNRQIYGNGTGALATTSATTALNTVTVSSLQYFGEDMMIDIWTAANLAANSTPKATSRRITAIDDVAGTITFDGAPVTFTAGDVFTRAGNANREITGLGAIVAATGTLYNIDPTVVRQWKATVDSNGGTPRPLSESLLIKNVDAVFARGGQTSIMITSLGVRRAYFNLLSQQRKFVNTKEFTGGFEGLAFTTDNGEIGLLADTDSPLNTVWGLDESHLKIYREADWQYMDMDGNKWVRVPGSVSGTWKDAYAATQYMYTEVATDRRNAHFKIADVTEA